MSAEVGRWLYALGLGDLRALFEQAQIDAESLPFLTEHHLREIGVPVGPRVRLLAAIARLGAARDPAPEPAIERRRLTVVFADLVGSTPLSAVLDPEDLRELIRAFHYTVDAEVARLDGFVAQYKGDGALVYFGYPRAHEDDAERAVRAALAIARAVPKLPTPAGVPLAAHLGVATGLAVVGDTFGHSGARERSAIGETPNLAARLVDLAASGQVVVSEQTWRLTQHQFEFLGLGAHRLKGLPEPIAAYRLIDERRTETRFNARNPSAPLEMVGRDGELSTLRGLWERASAGQGQVVLVSGEAGIGKSRLVRALESTLAGQAHSRISNQCAPHHAGSALYPMARQIARAAELSTQDDAPTQLAKLRALLYGAEDFDVLLTAQLLEIDTAPGGVQADITPALQRSLTFRALVRHFERTAQAGPVLWVLEDAHWIDPTTLELVQQCVERAAGLPVLAVVTARPEFQHPFGRLSHVHEMRLDRLQRDDVAALVRKVCKAQSLPASVLEQIIVRTDGVPLFVEEFTRSLLDAAQWTGDAQPAGPGAGVSQLAVPASLHDSLMARLDRHRTLKEVAQVAACIGREFAHDLLEQIAGMPSDVLTATLAQLQDAELVFRKSSVQHLYVFKHALVRDAAYESLLLRRREDLHARILAVLQSAADSPAELMAYHAGAAGLRAQAIELWCKASAQAMSRNAFAEATTHLEAALQLNAELPKDPKRDSQRLDLLLVLGQATIPYRGYSHSRSVEVFSQAAELAESLHDGQRGFWVAYARWVVHYVRGEHETSLAIARRMFEQARQEEHAGRTLTAQRAQGISEMIGGAPTAADLTFAQAEQLAELVRQQPRDRRMAAAQRFAADPEIATQFHVALTHWAMGRVGRATALSQQAVEAARAMGHVHTLGHALAHGAIVAVVDRNPGLAIALCEETAALVAKHEMELWRGYGNMLHGFALVLSGEVARAIGYLESGLDCLSRAETGTMVPIHHAVCAWALAHEGRLDAAQRHLELVDAELRQGSERYFWAECLIWRGHCQLLLPGAGRDHAEVDYARALAEARQQQAVGWQLRAATELGRSWLVRGQGRMAADVIGPLLASIEGGRRSPLVLAAEAVLGSAALLSGG